MIKTERLNYFLLLSFWIIVFSSSVALAKKIELSGGLFNFNSTNSRSGTTASLSGFGAYHFGYKYALLQQYELDVGYSLIASKGFGGDLAFGFDVGANYFPTSLAEDYRFENSQVKASIDYHWRPFVGVAFHQRNFQSTSSQYAGWGLKFGMERSWTSNLQWIGSIRYGVLNGPNQSSATQLELLIGGIFNFW